MATYNNFHTPLKKRTHLAFGNEEINISIFKSMLKLDSAINSELIIKKFAKLNINYKKYLKNINSKYFIHIYWLKFYQI